MNAAGSAPANIPRQIRAMAALLFIRLPRFYDCINKECRPGCTADSQTFHYSCPVLPSVIIGESYIYNKTVFASLQFKTAHTKQRTGFGGIAG
jgi:hypothetical protein